MPHVKLTAKGNFTKLSSFLEKFGERFDLSILDKYGQAGVSALEEATPKDIGLTSRSWYYKITRNGSVASLEFHNSNINKGVPIAIILQYGHGTRNGGWVEGRDYINPALRPIFDELAKNVWNEVSSSCGQ